MIDLSGARWRKSTKSASNGGCVEVANLDTHVAVRDSQHPEGAKLVFTAREWDRFHEAARKGEFTLR